MLVSDDRDFIEKARFLSQQALEGVPGIEFMPKPEWSRSSRWLTVILITPEAFGADREAVRLALESENIESRPVWKPMHLQPVLGKNPLLYRFRLKAKIGKIVGALVVPLFL